MIDAMTDETNVPAGGSNPQQHTVPPAPAAESASAKPADALSSGTGGAHAADFAKIISEIKLPERRDEKGQADKRAIEVSPLIAGLDAPTTKAETSDTPAAPEQVVAAPAPRSSEPTESSVRSLHTLKQDLQHVVRDQKISVVRAAALEQEKRRTSGEPGAEKIDTQPSARSHLASYVAASFGLLALGALALFGVYYVESSRQTPQQQTSGAIVFAEQSVSLPLTGQGANALKQTLGGARAASNAGLGSITRIVPIVGPTTAQQRPATFGEFMVAIEASPPDDLLRALSDDFFLGLHTIDKNAPLIVVPVLSYDRAFAGMLAWESAMNGDLAPLFTPLSRYANVNGIPEERRFSDVVMRNYDVRALKDDSGQIQLYYSFPTRGILIIAESPYTFTEVLTRLQADRKL